MIESLLSPKDVARILNCSVSTAYRKMESSKMPGVKKFDGLIRVTETGLDSYIKSCSVKPSKDKSRALKALYEVKRGMR